ncbi:alpha beta-hydrolase [Butyriboletus roseoflavus]|nr:alpha beta-hydrolase [Butyriboletus roseoflavus]
MDEQLHKHSVVRNLDRVWRCALKMNSSLISLPVRLVVLLRRLVHIISSLSLTNQYILQSLQSPDPRPRRFPSSWLISTYSLPIDPPDRACSRPTDNVSSPEPTPLDSTSPGPRDDQPSSGPPPRGNTECQDTIHRLMNNPALFDPARAPRYPIVLCHGLYGFDVRGPAAFPSLRLQYWSSVLSILKHKLGAEVIVTGVPGTGSIASRAENLDRILRNKACGRGINLIAHSMGGLDCRHLVTHVRPTEYVPLSLTSISTPHRGSPFMDWCTQYLGLGRQQYGPTNQRASDAEQPTQLESGPTSSADVHGTSEKRETAFRLSLSTLPSSFTTLLLSLIDSPAYANLTTSYLNDVFNPSTPDDPRVKYFSVASRIDEMNIWHPLWLPKMVLDDTERKARARLKAAAAGNTSYGSTVPPWEQENQWGNDGLVTVQSARWGEFLGILSGCDHWEIRGAQGMDLNVELPLGNITNRIAGEGWALGDWTRFIGAWKKQEKGASEGLELAGIVSSETGETGRITQDSRNDPVVKASTDKLSAVFDWIVEHVPTSGNASPKMTTKNDLATKLDLERFYVALTRKLYDEGL